MKLLQCMQRQRKSAWVPDRHRQPAGSTKTGVHALTHLGPPIRADDWNSVSSTSERTMIESRFVGILIRGTCARKCAMTSSRSAGSTMKSYLFARITPQEISHHIQCHVLVGSWHCQSRADPTSPVCAHGYIWLPYVHDVDKI